MAETQMKTIAKIKLSDNSVYEIRDANALHLSGGRLTGDLTVDTKITTGQLYIVSINYYDIIDTPTNVLVEDESTHEIMKRSTDKLLEDIGGISYSIDEATGTLSLKYGRQN